MHRFVYSPAVFENIFQFNYNRSCYRCKILNMSQRKRGPYFNYLKNKNVSNFKIPRQTIHNRKKQVNYSLFHLVFLIIKEISLNFLLLISKISAAINNEVPTKYNWDANTNNNSVSFVNENETTNQTRCDDLNAGDFSIVEQTMENDYDIEYFDTVHPNLSCSINDAMTTIYAFSIRHGLSWEAIEDMAHLVNAITGTDRVPTTKYKFKQKFERKNCTKPTVHFLCHSCDMYLDTKENLQNSNQNICSNCETEICTDTKYKKNHFLSIPIEHHLTNILQRNSNFINLNSDSSSSLIRDVHDANGFKKFKSEMLNIQYITLTVNTDGGAVFKKTKDKSFWPIQFYVNEIDLEHRFDRENMLCSSMSFGKI